MRYALIMTVTVIQCFEILTILTLQNIVCQISSLLIKQNNKTKIIIGGNRTKPNKTK